MKKIISLIFVLLLILNCKSAIKSSAAGSFKLDNFSNKIIEYIWIAPEGNFYPVSKSVNIVNSQSFEVSNLEAGIYDIAIDFKGEYNSINSKKDKRLCLIIEKGETTIWSIDSTGNIKR